MWLSTSIAARASGAPRARTHRDRVSALAKVVVTARFPAVSGGWAHALPGHDVVGPIEGPEVKWPAERWRAEVADAAALICLLTDRIDAAVLEAAPRLRVVANYAVGVDNVDLAAAAARGVAVANTPDVLTEATADFTFALLLAVSRRLIEGEALVRADRWEGWVPDLLLGRAIETLGLVGYGRIGRAVARRARGFGMRVLVADTRGVPAVEEGDTAVALDALWGAVDAVTLHCPLTPATRGLVDARAIARMKPGTYLVNTARGAVIDEDAVADALESGHLGGAALDVFVGEPRIHPRLRAAPRTVLAPHLGSATTTARVRMAELCLSAVRDVLDGRRPPNLVPTKPGRA